MLRSISHRKFSRLKSLSLKVDSVEGISLNPFVNPFGGHHVSHTSLAHSVGIKHLEELLELIFLRMISVLYQNHLKGVSLLCKVDQIEERGLGEFLN